MSETLEQLVDPETLPELIDRGDASACAAWLDRVASRDSVYTVSHLSDQQRERLLELLNPQDAAEVIEHLPEPQAVDAIEHLETVTAARIIEALPSDQQADLINELDSTDAEAILEALPPLEAADVRRLAAYDEKVAGGLMMVEFLSFTPSTTVRDVLDDLERNAQRYTQFNVLYSYVVDNARRLRGVVALRKMLLEPRSRMLGEIMVRDPVAVPDTMPLEELSSVFGEHPYLGLPVLDPEKRLIGVVERTDVEHALVEDSDERYRQTQGIIGGEEVRSMPLRTRAGRRLAWLSINIVLNILAASVIAFHQDTLEAVIALAVFLPIISDMSGCSGNQAVAVSIRELTLGVTRPGDLWDVLRKELSVGLVNGLALGLLLGLVAFAWKGNPYLGCVVGGALMANTLVAVALGGLIPLALKGMNLDPALASGPVLTTVTDMCGFLLVLSLAAATLSRLQGL